MCNLYAGSEYNKKYLPQPNEISMRLHNTIHITELIGKSASHSTSNIRRKASIVQKKTT